MLGAIVGDIVGSIYEFNNHRSKDFPLFGERNFFTDDSIMSIAIAQALLDHKKEGHDLRERAIYWMQHLGHRYPNGGYGGMFSHWLDESNPAPYNSFGNGAAMRVSPCAWVANSLEEALKYAEVVTAVTHNHPEGIKGAEATVVAIFMALKNRHKEEIKELIENFYYPLNFTLDEIRPTYRFNETCQDTVPQALVAFFESQSFEEAIRNAISIGGDSDTLAAITGSVAEAYYGIPKDIQKKALSYLDDSLLALFNAFNEVYPVGIKSPQKC